MLRRAMGAQQRERENEIHFEKCKIPEEVKSDWVLKDGLCLQREKNGGKL